mmetsp:Transcript_72616/g.166559  ORF Transcript_72616/g.166559 Transcript_72616/m.166559 type:complete len:154 (-) Transcript_72616:1016-1477(-)
MHCYEPQGSRWRASTSRAGPWRSVQHACPKRPRSSLRRCSPSKTADEGFLEQCRKLDTAQCVAGVADRWRGSTLNLIFCDSWPSDNNRRGQEDQLERKSIFTKLTTMLLRFCVLKVVFWLVIRCGNILKPMRDFRVQLQTRGGFVFPQHLYFR